MFTHGDSNKQKIEPCYSIDGNSINFASSNKDPEIVEIIWQNSNKFAQLIVNCGFRISFHADNDNNVDIVQLIQISDDCDYREAICNMETLLKSLKKKRNSFSLTRPISNILTAHKERKKARREELEKQKEEERIAKWRESFLNQVEMSVIKSSTDILDDICHRLTVEKHGCAPLQDIRSIECRRKTIVEFIEFLQKPIGRRTVIDQVKRSLLGWFTLNTDLQYKPSVDEFQHFAKEFKENFQVENVVGTIHYVVYSFPLPYGTQVQALAIIDKKIFASSFGTCKKTSLHSLYIALKHHPYRKTFKFAIDCLHKPVYSDVFTPCYNIHAFIDNEKIVTWMWNNLKFLQHTQRCGNPIVQMCNFFSSYGCPINRIREIK